MAGIWTIYGFYGLAFFVLGVAVAVRVLAFAPSQISFRFLALAAFGLIHGCFEWLALAAIMDPPGMTPAFEQALAASSFVALAYFALSAWDIRPRLMSTALGLASLSWTVAALLLADPVALEVATRWGLAVPASALTAAAFMRIGVPELRTRLDRAASIAAGLTFAVYAILQLFVTPGEFFPASVFSTTAFEAATGVSVLVARTGAGFVMTGAILVLLQSFDNAIRDRLNRVARRARAELQMNRAMLQSVFELAPTGIAIYRPEDGRILESNQALAELSGYSGSQLNTLNFHELWAPPASADGMAEPEDWRASDGRFGPCETKLAGPDGRLVPVVLQGVRLAGEPGGTTVLAVIQDIGEQKQTQQLLINQREAADAANAAKSQFLANMSHEIRTPLNGVLGLAAILAKSDLAPKQAGIARMIKQSGEILLFVLNDILDFSRIEAGRLTIERTVFPLSSIQDRIEDLYRHKADGKGIALDICMRGDLAPTYFGDPNRVLQVLNNLVSNAIKFTEAGSVEVLISAQSEHGRAGHILFEVRDTGIGLTEEQRGRIFERFTQADESTTRRFGGSGLGLAIVQGLVDAMGGEVESESVIGSGSSFPVYLPLAPASGSARIDAGPAPEPVRLDPISILIAEDNPLNRSALQTMLEEEGHSLQYAQNGEEAAKRALADRFDLILMDVQMPVLDGCQALLRIRELEAGLGRPPTPIIACTANALEDNLQEYSELGFNATITKPVSPDELYAMIYAVAARKNGKMVQ